MMRLVWLFYAAVLWCQTPAPLLTNAEFHSPGSGPAAGRLLVIGGGDIGAEILDEFRRLAGGSDAPVVVIPTAGEHPGDLHHHPLRLAGFTQLTMLHTRERSVADTEAFVEPLRKARGVWIDGGRQWRLVDSYLGTRTQREMEALLLRGGVIAGTSAGATIQGGYLVRGAREGNHVMMAPGYEEGFGFLRNVAVDQHLTRRKRENDLLQVIALKPEILGIGIDENTAILVAGNTFRVIGEGRVAIYDSNYGVGADGKQYYWLSPGACFQIVARKQQACEAR